MEVESELVLSDELTKWKKQGDCCTLSEDDRLRYLEEILSSVYTKRPKDRPTFERYFAIIELFGSGSDDRNQTYSEWECGVILLRKILLKSDVASDELCMAPHIAFHSIMEWDCLNIEEEDDDDLMRLVAIYLYTFPLRAMAFSCNTSSRWKRLSFVIQDTFRYVSRHFQSFHGRKDIVSDCIVSYLYPPVQSIVRYFFDNENDMHLDEHAKADILRIMKDTVEVSMRFLTHIIHATMKTHIDEDQKCHENLCNEICIMMELLSSSLCVPLHALLISDHLKYYFDQENKKDLQCCYDAMPWDVTGIALYAYILVSSRRFDDPGYNRNGKSMNTCTPASSLQEVVLLPYPYTLDFLNEMLLPHVPILLSLQESQTSSTSIGVIYLQALLKLHLPFSSNISHSSLIQIVYKVLQQLCNKENSLLRNFISGFTNPFIVLKDVMITMNSNQSDSDDNETYYSTQNTLVLCAVFDLLRFLHHQIPNSLEVHDILFHKADFLWKEISEQWNHVNDAGEEQKTTAPMILQHPQRFELYMSFFKFMQFVCMTTDNTEKDKLELDHMVSILLEFRTGLARVLQIWSNDENKKENRHETLHPMNYFQFYLVMDAVQEAIIAAEKRD